MCNFFFQFNSLLSINIKFIANYIYINGVIYTHINTNTYEKSANKKTKYMHISTNNTIDKTEYLTYISLSIFKDFLDKEKILRRTCYI